MQEDQKSRKQKRAGRKEENKRQNDGKENVRKRKENLGKN